MNISRTTSKWAPAACAAGILLLGSSGLASAGIGIGASSAPQPTPAQVYPSTVGNSTFYSFTINNGDSLVDSIPVQLCMTGQESSDWTSYQVAVQPQGSGGNLPGVTRPANVMFVPSTTLPVCKTVTISINTGPLVLDDPSVAQQFAQNLNILDVLPMPDRGAAKPAVHWSGSTEVHIRVHVKPVENNISCFITDSAGNLLTKCDGTLADESGTDAGRFIIVVNKKAIEVSTNPGQFYYNVLYKNSGSSAITVDVDFLRNGVGTKGTNAIHAGLFPPQFSGFTQDGFNEVNESIPEGADDQVRGITIPAGWTLWVDYHLDWNGLGGPVPANCATNCPTANQGFSVTGTVTEADSGHSESCTAGAWGYRK